VIEAPAPPSTAPDAPKRSRVPLVLFSLVLLGAAAGGLYFKKKHDDYEAWRWAKIPMSEALAHVPAQWSANTLGERLQKSGKVRDADTFQEAAEAVGLKSVAAGGYKIPTTASPRDLALIFKGGPTHQKVTFPEGFTGLQIAARLKKNGFEGAQALETLVYPAQGYSQYEGTLFPSTYELPLRASGKALMVRLQEQYQAEIAKLPRPFPSVDGKPVTIAQLVNIASILEREATDAKEMPLIAGVIYNRLRKKMRLQVDATIQYARILGNQGHKQVLYYEDLKIESPFNTYQIDGLPPTPICNPGADALKAAARPKTTDALFYVYSSKSKRSLFAVTYAEHLKNVRTVRLERDAEEKASKS
jgi:UPF0755 protein